MTIRFIFFIASVYILLYGCQHVKTSDINTDSHGYHDEYMFAKDTFYVTNVLIDSLPIYSETRVTFHNLDSIIAEVTFINNWNKSVWLYKPILPTDSLVENSFILRMENDNDNIPHLHKPTSHKYRNGNQDLMPAINPEISESSLLEFLPNTKLVFCINLSEHYDFKNLNTDSFKAIYVWYSMRFPYIINRKQILLPYNDKGLFFPAYIIISPRDIHEATYRKIGQKVILQNKKG